MVKTPLTLSTRMMLSFGAALTLFGLIISLAAHQGISRILDDALHDKAQSLARQLSVVSTDALLVYDYGTLERYVADLAMTPHIRYLSVRDTKENTLAEAGKKPGVSED